MCGIRIGEDVRGAIPCGTRGSRPPNRGRRRDDATARAAQRVQRSLFLLLRGSSFSLTVRRARSGSLRRGGGAGLVSAAPMALFSKPAFGFLALVLAAFAQRRVRISAHGLSLRVPPPLMPGQHHRERDRCEHHIQVKADVEEAQSSFGAEAFRPSFARTVPACHIRTHLELTGGSSPHVSVVEPAFGGCEIGVEIARFRTTLLTPHFAPTLRVEYRVGFQKG